MRVSVDTLVSVVIDNFDNAALLPAAVDSALAQTHPRVEVVVVDDGSADGSGAVIAGYGDRIVAVDKANGGQASALNAGFAATTGQAVVFLDSDDVLAPTAAATVAVALDTPGVGRVQWPLPVIDAAGHVTGEVGCTGLEEGDLREAVLTTGPFSYGWASTSGNGWARHVLEAVLPIPERDFALCPDIYLSTVAPLYGAITVVEPQSWWRRHDANASRPAAPFDERLAVGVRRFEACLAALRAHATRCGLPLDEARWRANSWFHRLDRAIRTLVDAVAPDETVIVIDDDSWELEGEVRGRRVWPLVERGGVYGGPPADGRQAVAELERLRRDGAGFLAVAWPSTWWLEHYTELSDHLRATYPRIAATDDVTLFDLRAAS